MNLPTISSNVSDVYPSKKAGKIVTAQIVGEDDDTLVITSN